MSIISLFGDGKNENGLEELIAICKSDSRINGARLRGAHYALGRMLAKKIIRDLHNPSLTVIVIMRAGLCFGMGIADELEEYGINVSILFYCDEEQWKNEKANCPQVFENDILLVDAVINTGNSIIQFSKTLPKSQTIFFSSNVISDKALNQFDNKSLYTVRISEKSFKGDKTDILKDGKGPDTGDRLFNTK